MIALRDGAPLILRRRLSRNAARRIANGLASGTYQGETFNFESPGAFFCKLTEKRWAIVHALQADGGEIGVRERARRVGRDVKRVHTDGCVLAEIGLIEWTEAGGLRCPFADLTTKAASKTCDLAAAAWADQRHASWHGCGKPLGASSNIIDSATEIVSDPVLLQWLPKYHREAGDSGLL